MFVKGSWRKHQLKPIRQLTLDGEFVKDWPSHEVAHKTTGIYHIQKAAAGIRMTAGGYRWEYIKEEHKKLPAKRKYRPVLQISTETGNILGRYDSVREAAKEWDIHTRDIYRACSDGASHRDTAKGYIWRYADEERGDN